MANGNKRESSLSAGRSCGATDALTMTDAADIEKSVLNFASKLAHNEKRKRDKAVGSLSRWLCKAELEPLAYKKLWRGLFYCMWMADKDHVQRELAHNICSLLHVVPAASRPKFVEAFFSVMGLEWLGLDRLRMDKFYMFVSKMLTAIFTHLSQNGWECTMSKDLIQVIVKGPLTEVDGDPSRPVGLMYHLCETYTKELRAVLESCTNAPSKRVLSEILFEPLLRHVLGHTTNKLVFDRVVENVLDPILADVESARSGDIDEEEWNWESKGLISAKELSRLFFEVASSAETPSKFRKRLYRWKGRFDDLTAPEDDGFEEEHGTTEAPKKKKVKKSKKRASEEADDDAAVPTKVAKKKKVKASAVQDVEGAAKPKKSKKASAVSDAAEDVKPMKKKKAGSGTKVKKSKVTA